MPSLNKATIIGHLGQDPEIKYMQSGTAVCNFSVATTEKWVDKDSSEKKEKTEWHRVSVFGKLAEICGKYLTKGKPVYIEGKLQTRSWEKDGVTRYTTEIIAKDMIMLGGRDETRNESGGGGNENTPYGQGPGYDDSPDDIPF